MPPPNQQPPTRTTPPVLSAPQSLAVTGTSLMPQHSNVTVPPPVPSQMLPVTHSQMPGAQAQSQIVPPPHNQFSPPSAQNYMVPPSLSHLPPPALGHVPPPSAHNQRQMHPPSQSHMPPQPQSHVYPPLQSRMPPSSAQSQMQMHPLSQSHMPPPSAHSQMQMHPPSQSHAYPPSASHALSNSAATARVPPPQPPTPYNDAIDISLIPRPLTNPFPSPYYPRAQMGQPPPPQLAAAIDDGNATPHVLRSTVYQFPATRAQWHSTGDIPLALQCMPLAVSSQDFVPPPRHKPDESTPENYDETTASVPMLPITNAPPRCTNCLAYANPFATDTICIFCGIAQTHTLVTARPEATVEWEVTGPYITRATPVQPVQIYVLDLTCPYVEEYKSLLKKLGQDMEDHFQQQSFRTLSRIGICLVSSMGIMIPRWHASSGDISCMVVADVTEEPFAPIPLEEWTFAMDESAEVWMQYIDNLDLKQWRKQAFARNAYGLDGSELSCGGAALAFLSNALASSGGRGTLLTWRRPNFGVGTLAFREESQALLLGRSKNENTTTYVPVQDQKKPEGKDDETAAVFYNKLAEDCVKNRVTLDIVMHSGPVSPNSFLGLASLAELCRVTSGSLYWVQAVNWEESLYTDLRDNIRAFTGWDAVFKVRCSAGVQIKKFIHAPGKPREGALGDSPELELASVSPNTCISVELDHRVGGIPKTSSVVYFQTALLYTSLSGRRLVRVSTLAIPIARSANDIFQSADFPAILPYLVRTTHTHLVKTINEQKQKKDDKTVARQKVRDALFATCLNMLVNYRLNTSAVSSPTGQLLLPSRLQLLPLFCMCLLKRPSLAPGFPCRDQSSAGARIQPSGDERGYFNFQLLQSNPASCMLLLYPNIYSIESSCQELNDGMPPMVRPSMESFQDDGIYLIDDGLRVFLYMGRLVPDDTKDACASRRHEALERWLWQIRTNRKNCPAVIPVFQQPDHQGLRETEILSLMVEDASAGEKDYVAFLTTMHCDIRNRLQSKK